MKQTKFTQKQFGFNLIELMITVAIVGVLAAFALPNYLAYMERGRRVDATNALMKIAAEQEKFYLDNNSYMDSATFTANADDWFDNTASENGYYTLSVSTTNAAANFIATATPATGKPQAQDTQCKTLSINESGMRTATGTNSGVCWR